MTKKDRSIDLDELLKLTPKKRFKSLYEASHQKILSSCRKYSKVARVYSLEVDDLFNLRISHLNQSFNKIIEKKIPIKDEAHFSNLLNRMTELYLLNDLKKIKKANSQSLEYDAKDDSPTPELVAFGKDEIKAFTNKFNNLFTELEKKVAKELLKGKTRKDVAEHLKLSKYRTKKISRDIASKLQGDREK